MQPNPEFEADVRAAMAVPEPDPAFLRSLRSQLAPDSSAIVFTTQGGHPDRRTIHYYQLADRTLKTYADILPTRGGFPDRVIWGRNTSSFFLVVSSSQELEFIDPLKDQFLLVDRSIGEIYNTDFTWVGGEK